MAGPSGMLGDGTQERRNARIWCGRSGSAAVRKTDASISQRRRIL